MIQVKVHSVSPINYISSIQCGHKTVSWPVTSIVKSTNQVLLARSSNPAFIPKTCQMVVSSTRRD